MSLQFWSLSVVIVLLFLLSDIVAHFMYLHETLIVREILLLLEHIFFIINWNVILKSSMILLVLSMLFGLLDHDVCISLYFILCKQLINSDDCHLVTKISIVLTLSWFGVLLVGKCLLDTTYG